MKRRCRWIKYEMKMLINTIRNEDEKDVVVYQNGFE